MNLKHYITPVAVNEGLDNGVLHKDDDIVKAAVTQVAAYDYFYNDASDDSSDDSSTDTPEVAVDETPVDETPVVDNSEDSSEDSATE